VHARSGGSTTSGRWTTDEEIYIYTVYHADGAEELIKKHNINYLRENRKATRTTKVTWTPTKTPAMNSISNSPEAPTVLIGIHTESHIVNINQSDETI
jgi:IS30 family transposase